MSKHGALMAHADHGIIMRFEEDKLLRKTLFQTGMQYPDRYRGLNLWPMQKAPWKDLNQKHIAARGPPHQAPDLRISCRAYSG